MRSARVLVLALALAAHFSHIRGDYDFLGCASHTYDACRTCNGPVPYTEILVFALNTSAGGAEPYVFRGTGVPMPLADICPGTCSSNPAHFTAYDGRVVFAATRPAEGREIWYTDGDPLTTPTRGTHLFADIEPGPGSSDPAWFTPVGYQNMSLYFAATTAAAGRELWYVGTFAATPGLTLEPSPGAASSDVDYVERIWLGSTAPSLDLDFYVVAAATSPVFGREPHVYARTVFAQAVDLAVGAASSNPTNFIHTIATFLFTADVPAAAIGRELYAMDWDSGDAYLVRDINSGAGSSDPTDFIHTSPGIIPTGRAYGTTAVFSAHAVLSPTTTPPGVDSGVELLISQGRAFDGSGGTSADLIADMRAGSANGNPRNAMFMRNRLFAIGSRDTLPVMDVLWIRSFTPSNATYTTLVCTIADLICAPVVPTPPLNLTEECHYTFNCTLVTLPVTVGPAQFTQIDQFFATTFNVTAIKFMVVQNVGLFLDAVHPASGRELWFVDYLITSFSLIAEILPGAAGFDDITGMVSHRSRLYFFGKHSGAAAWTLYSSNGAVIDVVASSLGIGVGEVRSLFVAPPVDDCGVCGGGNSAMDVCGVCFGAGNTCTRDCFGVDFGPALRDACGDCRNGTGDPQFNLLCRDCNHVPYGPAAVDSCGVCHAAGKISPCYDQTCADCTGVMGGSVRLDACGVCGGDGRSCTDCGGFVHKPLLTIPAQHGVNYDTEYFRNGTVCSNDTEPVYEETCLVRIPLYYCNDIAVFTPRATLAALGCITANGTYLGTLLLTNNSQCTKTQVATQVVVRCTTHPANVTDACYPQYNATERGALLQYDALPPNATLPCGALRLFGDNVTLVAEQCPHAVPNVPGLLPARCCVTAPGNRSSDLWYNSAVNCSSTPLDASCRGYACNHPDSVRKALFYPATCDALAALGLPAGKTLVVQTQSRGPGAAYDTTATVTVCVNAQASTANYTAPCAASVPLFTNASAYPPEFVPRDACGVCRGNGSACADCRGVPAGPFVADLCGVCILPDSPLLNTLCRDCAGVYFGNNSVDACGVCRAFGSPFANTTCTGCDGYVASGAVLDACLVCGGDGSTCHDCAGTLYGSKIVDRCGLCKEYNDPTLDTGCDDCAGVPGGGLVVDGCGLCGGTNATCADCAGTPHGTHVADVCGHCFPTNTSLGFNASCVGCDGVPNSGIALDFCGVCGGSNSTCTDCFGVHNGPARRDACGVCAGNNATCTDCSGTLFGVLRPDACGVCSGNNATCTGNHNLYVYCLISLLCFWMNCVYRVVVCVWRDCFLGTRVYFFGAFAFEAFFFGATLVFFCVCSPSSSEVKSCFEALSTSMLAASSALGSSDASEAAACVSSGWCFPLGSGVSAFFFDFLDGARARFLAGFFSSSSAAAPVPLSSAASTPADFFFGGLPSVAASASCVSLLLCSSPPVSASAPASFFLRFSGFLRLTFLRAAPVKSTTSP